jgi:hypothetical protein
VVAARMSDLMVLFAEYGHSNAVGHGLKFCQALPLVEPPSRERSWTPMVQVAVGRSELGMRWCARADATHGPFCRQQFYRERDVPHRPSSPAARRPFASPDSLVSPTFTLVCPGVQKPCVGTLPGDHGRHIEAQ